jgi:hypothetical protein
MPVEPRIDTGNTKPLNTTAAKITTYVDTTGTVGTTCTCYITAINAAVEGASSTESSAAPQLEGTEPTDNTLIYVGGAMIGAAVIAVLAYFLMRRKK